MARKTGNIGGQRLRSRKARNLKLSQASSENLQEQEDKEELEEEEEVYQSEEDVEEKRVQEPKKPQRRANKCLKEDVSQESEVNVINKDSKKHGKQTDSEVNMHLLRRSSRSTRNTRRMVDDLDEGRLTPDEDELDYDKENPTFDKKIRTLNTKKIQNSTVNVRGLNRLKVENHTKLLKTKKRKEDDEEYECDDESDDQENEEDEKDNEYNDGSDEQEEENSDGKNKRGIKNGGNQRREGRNRGLIDLKSKEESEENSESEEKENKGGFCFRSRSAEQILKEQVRVKEKRKKNILETYVERQEDDSDIESKGNDLKRTRQDFQECGRQQFLEMPILDENSWPKYIGTIQCKAKVQFEIFGYMRKIEFIQMKRWATRTAHNLKRGEELQIDFRPIDERRGTNRTLSLPCSRLHTNITIQDQTFGVLEHDSCEIWNFLAYKNYVTLKAYCANPHTENNTIDENKAFDVILDVFINKSFVDDPITLSQKEHNQSIQIHQNQGSQVSNPILFFNFTQEILLNNRIIQITITFILNIKGMKQLNIVIHFISKLNIQFFWGQKEAVQK